MKKGLLSLTLAAAMAFSLTGCRSAESAATRAPTTNAAPAATAAEDGETDAAEETGAKTPAADSRINIITSTASQGDGEITQANKIKEKYDNMIVIPTYPDNFSTEIETVISNAVVMASGPVVKAIAWCQAILGTAAAINKVCETRSDMISIAGIPGEDPGVINSKADIILQINEPGCGIIIPPQIKAQRAKTMIHYSFLRHMGYALIVAHHENLKKHCAENGIELVDIAALGSTGDSDITGAQQLIFEDIPCQAEGYGKDIVFFTTNYGMQELLIRSVSEQDAVHSLQYCPSLFHASSTALSIDMTGHEADVGYILDQFQVKIDKVGMNGGISTWGVPCNMLFVEAGVEYAKKVLEGQTNGVVLDDQVLRGVLQECAGEIQMTIDSYVDDSGSAKDNRRLVIADFITFE